MLPLLLLVGESGTACGDIATLLDGWTSFVVRPRAGRQSDDVVCVEEVKYDRRLYLRI